MPDHKKINTRCPICERFDRWVARLADDDPLNEEEREELRKLLEEERDVHVDAVIDV